MFKFVRTCGSVLYKKVRGRQMKKFISMLVVICTLALVSVSALALILVSVSALVLVSGWDFVPMFVSGPMSASYVLTFKGMV